VLKGLNLIGCQVKDRRMIPIAPTRGLIYDRNGIPLVRNVSWYAITLTPYLQAIQVHSKNSEAETDQSKSHRRATGKQFLFSVASNDTLFARLVHLRAGTPAIALYHVAEQQIINNRLIRQTRAKATVARRANSFSSASKLRKFIRKHYQAVMRRTRTYSALPVL
jgi:cell division protein FtsI/penicillin-binding protein 2